MFGAGELPLEKKRKKFHSCFFVETLAWDFKMLQRERKRERWKNREENERVL